MRDHADDLAEALRELLKLCDNVPVFQLDGGKSSAKAVRLAGKFMTARDTAQRVLSDYDEATERGSPRR